MTVVRLHDARLVVWSAIALYENEMATLVAGTREREAALVVHRPSGTTIVLNDLVGNVRDAMGLAGTMFRLAGFAGREPPFRES